MRLKLTIIKWSSPINLSHLWELRNITMSLCGKSTQKSFIVLKTPNFFSKVFNFFIETNNIILKYFLFLLLHAQVFCLTIITCCCELKVLSFTFQRGAASNKNHLLSSGTMDFDFDSSELPTTFIKKVNSNIKDLEETSVSTSELDLEAMESTKLTKRKHHNNNNNTKTKEQAPVTVHSILNGPTNKMRAYLRSKTGQFLRMGPNGELGGTEDMRDKYGE